MPLTTPSAPALAIKQEKGHTKPKSKASTAKTSTELVTTKSKKRPKLKWRTRDSQNSHLYNLQLDINDLRQEIQSLHQMREILLAQTLNRMDDRVGSFVKVVQEYHRVFQYGYQPLAQLSNGQVVNTMDFLSSVMDERVSIGRFVGLDMMRDQWTRYSAAFSGLVLTFISSEVLPQIDYVPSNGDSVRSVVMITSKASYASFFTVETISVMFPHLLQHRSIVDKLLGKTFRGIVHFDYVFDTNTHRVIGYDFRLDILDAFARLLHDPEDLCVLFEGAKISEESLIGDLNVYPQQRSSTASASRIQKMSRDDARYSEAAQMRERQRKLTKILDPEDRIEHIPLVQGQSAPLPGLSTLTSRPWQLQMSSILTDGQEEEVKENRFSVVESEDSPAVKQEPQQQALPRLPSLPYFSPRAIGKSGTSTQMLGKRQLNPFASGRDELLSP
uniref:Uncharacterized protein n=1 Tax=Globisporangium ultimum (strain ATCC 200006 / CBS 805.95 / DAOM BR144) TaxID=431595 RepID=K3X657_GLOUD